MRLAGLFVFGAGLAMAGPDNGCAISAANILSPQTKVTRGVATSIAVTTTGCSSPFRTFQLATGTLPPGLTLVPGATGATISGTPTTSGVYVFTLRAIDATYRLPNESAIIQVNDPLQIDTPAAATGAQSAAYTDTIRARGGSGPYTFSIVEGALPTGLTLDASTGAITGTMPAAGSKFRVRVTDSSSPANTAEKAYTIVPSGQVTTVTTPPVGSTGSSYSFDIDGALGVSGFAVALGTLPPGLTIDTNGVISGTPTTVGEYHFTVRQTVSTASVWRSYRIFINSAGTVTGTPRNAEESASYNHAFGVSGGVAPFTYAVTAGALPTGLTLNAATGAITGTLPLSASGTAFTVTATDASGRSYVLATAITAVTRLTGSGTTPPTVRVPLSRTFTPYSLSAGGPGKEFKLIGGVGEQQVFIDPVTGSTQYSFVAPGTFTPIVLGTDSLGGAVLFNTVQYKAVGNLALNTLNEIPNAIFGTPYSTTLSVSNGDFTPLSFAVTGGTLPTGFTLGAATGILSGNPDPMEGNSHFTFQVTVTDATGQTSIANYFIGIGSSSRITSTSLPAGTIGQSYNGQLQSSGGFMPLFDIPPGLPPGLSMNTSGTITGIPTTAGDYTIVVPLTDEFPVDSKQFTIHVAAAPSFTVAPATQFEATVKGSLFLPITQTGGRAPFTVTVSSGSLPDGLFMQQGTSLGINGVPMVSGNQTFLIQLQDADGRTANGLYAINVRENVLITTDTLPTATRNVVYNAPLAATLGLAPYTWGFAGGTLPPGLSIAPGGAITGTPTTNGVYAFTVLASDSASRATEKNFTLEINDAVAITSAAPLPNGLLQNAYSQTITTSGGQATKTFSISASDVAPLLAINPSTGVISGLPLLAGTYPFTVQVQDSLGRTATQAQQVTIQGGLSFTPATVPNGTVGTPYSVTFVPSNAVGAVAWSVSAGTLPPGVTLGAATGVLSGTPTTPGAFNFSIQALDSTAVPVTQAYLLQVANVLTIAPATLANAPVNAPYSVQLTASGGSGATGWSVTAGALPPGMNLGVTSGTLDGTPTTVGSYSFTVTATDSFSQTGSRAYTLLVLGTLPISPATLPNATVGAVYSQPLSVTGASGAVNWIVTAGALPSGLTLGAATGLLSGTPSVNGTFNFTVTATDALTQTGSRAYNLTVLNVLTISPASVANGTVGAVYSQQLTAAGGSGSIGWAVTAGALPAGLTLGAASGAITGTPTASGSFAFTVTATDSFTQTGSRAYTMSVAGVLTVAPATVANGTVGAVYSQQLTASGGSGAVGWAVTAGALPAGLTLGPVSGAITGTPTTSGSFSFTVTATDSIAQAGSQAYTMTVAAVLTIAPATVANGTVGAVYSQQLTASGGSGAVGWAVTAGALPAGLTLGAASGAITGTPTTSGSFAFTVTATDAIAQTGSRAYTMTVAGVLTIAPATVANGAVGTSYLQQLTASGGTGAIGWAVTAGALPAGLTLGPTSGAITGTPTASGSFAFTVTATDSISQAGSRAYTMTVAGVLSVGPNTVPNGTVGTAYLQQLTATGGTGAIGWAVTAGALPAGLTLGPTSGAITGTPTASGSFAFTVTATDSISQAGSQAYTMNVAGLITVAPNTVPNGTVGTSYLQQLTATGGTGAIGWAVTAGALPAGLTLGPTSGAITGTPTASGSFSFTVTATDSLSQAGSRAYMMTVAGVLTVAPSTVANGTVGTAYTQQLTATGGTGAIGWAVTAGALPGGLTLGPTSGAITGTPTASGSFTFTVTATDSLSQAGSRAYTMTVSGSLTIAPATVANGTVGTAYSQQLTATGGTGAISWAVTSGALPAGLALNQVSGLIGGTPTASGTFGFTVTATDSLSQAGTRTYSMQVLNVLTISPATLPNGIEGTQYLQTLTAGNGATGVSWTVSAGTLPAGLTLGPTNGQIGGTPTTPGSSTFTITATDSLSQTGSRAYTVTIAAQLTITPATLPTVYVGVPFSQTLTATNAVGAVTWGISGIAGGLPAGLTLSPTTGILSGTTNVTPGNYTVTVQATDAQSQAGQQTYTVRVRQPITIAPPTLPDATLGSAYSQTLTATNAAGTTSFAVTGGALPGGLTLNPTTGVLSGTPTALGMFAFDVSATTTQQQAATRSYTLKVVDPLAFSTATLPDGTEQEVYLATLTASGATTSGLTWSILTGALPPGLALNAATGDISGTPTRSGTYAFTAQVVNVAGTRASQALSITVVPVLVVTSISLGDAVQGRSFTSTLTAIGGRTPYTWTLVNSSLPAGLTLNPSTGQVTGTTSVTEGSYSQNVVVTDSRGRVARRTVQLTVSAPPPPSLAIAPDTLPNGRVNQAYSATFSATGGVPGYTFTLAQGSLPPGLTLMNGVLSGTPTQDGTYRFTVNANDSQNRVAGNLYTVVIEPALVPLSVTPSSIATTTPIGQAITLQFGATGGRAPYTFAITGNVPPGMSSNSSGVLSGTPSQGGTFAFTVEATDSTGTKANRSFSLTVSGNLTITTQPPLAEGTVGKGYTVTFGVAGGRAPYTWSASGTLPPGLTFDSGALSGTPTTAGTFTFTIGVQDSQRLSASAPFSITVWDPVTITNAPADTALISGQPFNFTFTTRGGKPPVTLTVTGGALPGGLTMTAAGVITGTPVNAGTFNFTVAATDALGNSAQQSATLRVLAPLTITTTSLPSGTVGAAYTASLAATGGLAPLGTWSVSQGALPDGLTLGADGTISGTPTAAGTTTFTVRISDANGTATTRVVSISVQLPPVPGLVISGLPQTLPPGTQTNITIQLAQPFPVPVTGTLTLIFEPNAVNNADDPSVQFSSGGRTVTFTIPAGQTVGTFPVTPLRLLSGTVAGTIRIQTTTSPASATPVPDAVVPITRSAPVITAGTAQVGTNSFTLTIDGFSNTREISSATFRLTPAAGSSLATTDVPVSVAATFAAYYQNAASAPFGGQFRLLLPFTVNGALTDIDSVVVTVTNSVGTSQPFTVRLR